jgi:hypothetical protein
MALGDSDATSPAEPTVFGQSASSVQVVREKALAQQDRPRLFITLDRYSSNHLQSG